ncbi:hypothetical protein [Halosimplex halobium]|uniref:hypothetical protein n=1 Tax=Halosimplex halobium TaxID=3396618 RepID=UPI003F564096
MKDYLNRLKDTVTGTENEENNPYSKREEFSPKKVRSEVEHMFENGMLVDDYFPQESRADIIDNIEQEARTFETKIDPALSKGPFDVYNSGSYWNFEQDEKDKINKWREEYVTAELEEIVNRVIEQIIPVVNNAFKLSEENTVDRINELTQKLAEYPALHYMWRSLVFAYDKIFPDKQLEFSYNV